MNCDLIAPWYRWLEYLTFGPALQRRRLQYIDDVANAKNVLILGDGDGRFTAEFLKRNPDARIDSIDLSAAMVRLAERRIRKSGLDPKRVRLLLADARNAHLRGSYDLVVSHYFLDCLANNEVEKLVERVSRAASPGARWLISEFRVPRRGLQRAAALLVIKALYLGFRILTRLRTSRLPTYATALESSGFRLIRQQIATGGLLVSELWNKTP
jgi:cyclopropane fatty-acyl-phospholipid synthase-like methyltransferase